MNEVTECLQGAASPRDSRICLLSQLNVYGATMQPVPLSKRKFISVILMALLVISMVFLLVFGRTKPALKRGILHSLTGTMESSEKPFVEMLQFALEEVNAGGGVNDQLLQAVAVDCRSGHNYCGQQAVCEADSAKPVDVQCTLLHQAMNVPEGIVAIDTDTRHLWKTPRIGQIRSDGQFDIVWDACRPLDLAPFPSYRLRDDWKRLLQTADGNLS